MNIYPYVYRIDHPSGEFYVGSRCANKVPAEQDFGVIYKTSSKKLSHPFEEYTWTILAEFYLPSGKTDAYDFEQALIFEHWGKPGLANKSCYFGKRRWSTAGSEVSVETRQKLSIASKGRRLTDSHRQALSAAVSGKIRGPQSDQHREKISRALAGRAKTDDTKQRMAESRKIRPPLTEEQLKNMSLGQKAAWERRKNQQKDIAK